MKLTPEQKLAQIDASRQRWQRRLTRATNALGKLERQRKRLAQAILAEGSKDLPVIATVKVRKLRTEEPKLIEPPKPAASDVSDIPVSEFLGHGDALADKLPEDDLSIPTFLKRTSEEIEAAKKRDAESAAKIKAEAEERRKAKARGRVARMKAKASGELRAMPLTGKAALEAIRRGHR